MGRQKHRGQHAQDAALFAPEGVAVLNEAIKDLAFLFSRNYADNASLTLVGDRYQLRKRQRLALMRACCPDDAIPRRIETHVDAQALQDKWVYIDGYNLLITMECILSRGILLHCRDGCYRDISSVHGTYRRVEETHEALLTLGETLKELGVQGVYWYLDAPVSNSGRLKSLMHELARDNGFNWEVELVNNPDQELADKTDEIVITSDRWILDHATQWFNLTGHILESRPHVHVTELRGA